MPTPLPQDLPQDATDKEVIAANGVAVKARHQNPLRFDALHATALKPWMMFYAHWLANEPTPPTAGERRAKLDILTGGRANVTGLDMILRKRPDFVAYFEEITAGPLQAARAAFKADLPEYVAGHKAAFDMALAAEDYSKIKDYTIPALERVWPRRDLVAQQTNITITLSEKQAVNIETEAIEVEAEIIE